MPSLSAAYQANGSNIVHDILEGEAVVLDLSTGVFYSLLGPATEVWAGIKEGRSLQAIVDRLECMFEGDRAHMENAVVAFVEQLLNEKLIVQAAPVTTPWGAPAAVAARLPFEAPQAVRYDDVEELLLLDPVHETDAAGWPVPKPTN